MSRRRTTPAYQHDLGLLVETHAHLRALGLVPSEGPFRIYGTDHKPVTLTHQDDIMACQAFEMLSKAKPEMAGLYGRKGLIRFFGNLIRLPKSYVGEGITARDGEVFFGELTSRYSNAFKTILGVDDVGHTFAYSGVIKALAVRNGSLSSFGAERDWQSVAGFTPKIQALKYFPPTVYKKAGWKIFQGVIEAIKAHWAFIGEDDYQVTMVDVALALVLQRCNISVAQADAAFAREVDRGHKVVTSWADHSLFDIFPTTGTCSKLSRTLSVDAFAESLNGETPFTTETITSQSSWDAFISSIISKYHNKCFDMIVLPALVEAKEVGAKRDSATDFVKEKTEALRLANDLYYEIGHIEGRDLGMEKISAVEEFYDANLKLEKLQDLALEAIKRLQSAILDVTTSDEGANAWNLFEAEDPRECFLKVLRTERVKNSVVGKGLPRHYAPFVAQLKDMGYLEDEINLVLLNGYKYGVDPARFVDYLVGNPLKEQASDPWLDISWENDTHEIVVLPRTSLQPPFMGILTSCCQHVLGGAAAECAYRSATTDHCVVYRKKGDLTPLFQAYVWRDKGYLVCDNIEPGIATPEVVSAWRQWGLKCVSEGGYKDVLVGTGYMMVPYGHLRSIALKAPSSYSDFKGKGYSLTGQKGGCRDSEATSRWFTDLFMTAPVLACNSERCENRFAILNVLDDDESEYRRIYSLGDICMNSGLSSLFDSIEDVVYRLASEKFSDSIEEVDISGVIGVFRNAFPGYISEEIASVEDLDPMAIYVDCLLPDGTVFSTGPNESYVGVNGALTSFPKSYVSMEMLRLLSDMAQDPEPYQYEDYDYFFGGAK